MLDPLFELISHIIRNFRYKWIIYILMIIACVFVSVISVIDWLGLMSR